MPVSTRVLGRLAAVLVAATAFLIVFGASVRVHGAGLACPDWPLCFGEVIPAIDFQVGLEFGHRVIAGVISLGFVALLTGILRKRQELGRHLVGLGLIAALVLIVQIILGGLTVLHLLAEWTVTSHLVAGNTFCLSLLLICLALRDAESPIRREAVDFGQRVVGLLMGGLVLAQVMLGGLVSSSHAGLACGPTWPACGMSWFPTLQGLVGLQVAHRLTAMLLVGTAVLALVVTLGRGRSGRAAWIWTAVVLSQAGIGIANVMFLLPVEITLLHSAGACALVLVTTWFNYEVFRAPVTSSVPFMRLSLPLESK
jgi:cytochrome c oxidase assembly protein subunit 15